MSEPFFTTVCNEYYTFIHPLLHPSLPLQICFLQGSRSVTPLLPTPSPTKRAPCLSVFSGQTWLLCSPSCSFRDRCVFRSWCVLKHRCVTEVTADTVSICLSGDSVSDTESYQLRNRETQSEQPHPETKG